MLSDRYLSGNNGVSWPNGWMGQGDTWYAGRPRPGRQCVRWAHSSPFPPKGAQQSHFSAHVCCGQTAGCIKIPLGMEVGLGPGHVMLDGDPAPPPPERGTATPTFRPRSTVAKWLLHQDTIWYRDRPWPRWHCIRWGPSSPHGKEHSSPPFFRPMSTLVKWSPISATAELIYTSQLSFLHRTNKASAIVLKETQSIDPNQWPGLTHSASTT